MPLAPHSAPAAPTLPERIEEAAGRPGAGSLTFVTGGAEEVVAVRRSSSTTPRRWPPGSRPGASRPAATSPCSARPPARSSPPSRRSGCAGRRSSSCRCRCASARSRSSRPQTRGRMRRADVTLAARRPRPGAVHRARARATRRWCRSTDLVPAPADPPRRVRPPTYDPDASPSCSSRRAARPSRRASCSRTARSAPTSTASPPAPGSTPTPTCSCRGCRCTTTWASSGSSCCRLTTGTPLVLGAPQDFLAAPAAVDGVAVALPRHGHRRAELLLRARRPGPAQARRASTCRRCGSR